MVRLRLWSQMGAGSFTATRRFNSMTCLVFARHGFVKFEHWRLYGELGLAGEDVSVWVYEGNLKVEYQATALALYELSIEKDTGKIAKVTSARRLETHFRSAQLDLWQISDTEWLLALRRPEPAARKKAGKIVSLVEQLVLPEFGATG